MSQYDLSISAIAASELAAFGESVTYAPKDGPDETITAIVHRGGLDRINEAQRGAALTHVLQIQRSDIASISRGDAFTFSDTQGGTATAHGDVQVDYRRTDAAFWFLNVR